jgi:eukaryotic-like serine/threonine-protein kinase
VGCDGLSRLSDFGIAKSVLASQRTAKHELLGKVLYMAPEYLRHERVDRTLDVYAMGITLFIALAGIEPWTDVSDSTLVSCILHEELPPIANAGVRIAPELEAIVRRATARDPRERYPTAAAMGQALGELSRRTGWMATHLEVAEQVEALCGEALRRLRGEVRDAHISSLPPARPTHALGTPGSLRDEPPRASGERRWSAAPVQRIRVVSRKGD